MECLPIDHQSKPLTALMQFSPCLLLCLCTAGSHFPHCLQAHILSGRGTACTYAREFCDAGFLFGGGGPGGGGPGGGGQCNTGVHLLLPPACLTRLLPRSSLLPCQCSRPGWPVAEAARNGRLGLQGTYKDHGIKIIACHL